MRKAVFKIGLLLLIFTYTVQAQLRPSFWWKCENGNTSYNYNPALRLDNNQKLEFDSILYSKEYTLIVVYKSIGKDETPVWKIHFNDSTFNGLTTQNIIFDKTTINYEETNRLGPIINTLQQTSPTEIDSSQVYCNLTLEIPDSINTQLDIAEIMYFDSKPPMGLLRRVQSYLAIKYGVTLGAVNYSDGQGKILWKYRNNSDYHTRILGVGTDSIYTLTQYQSHSECDSGIITLISDTLQQGQFCIMGDNNGSLFFERDSIFDIEYLQRIWKICQTYGENIWDTIFYSLKIDTSLLPNNSDSLVLIIDDEYYYPDSISNGTLHYSNIIFGRDSSFMVIAKGDMLWQGTRTKRTSQSSDIASSKISTQMYPNPTLGQYTIDVLNAKEVTVKIYNTLGSEILSYSDKDKIAYTFSGTLPHGNVYYVTITTEQGSQTMKLIVK